MIFRESRHRLYHFHQNFFPPFLLNQLIVKNKSILRQSISYVKTIIKN
jgi:hypothetical protein